MAKIPLTAQTSLSLQSQSPYKHLNTVQDLTTLRAIHLRFSEKNNASIKVVIPINYVGFFFNFTNIKRRININFHCNCNRDKAVKCITENYVTLMGVTLVSGHPSAEF